MPKKHAKPHQVEAHRQLKRFRTRALLADDMGLGKTFTTLMHAKLTGRERVVILCPASAKFIWEAEAKKFCGESSLVLEGTKVPKRGIRTDKRFVILNYDILPYWIDALRDWSPELVCMDEVHYIKGHTTERFEYCKALCEGVPYVIGLSGTPLTNRPTELWPILHILHPEKFRTFFSFAMKYSNPSREHGKWVFKGSKNLDKLHKRLKKLCMIRRRKQDVLTDLSPKIRRVVEVPVSDLDTYEQASRNFMHWLRSISPARAKKAERNIALVRVGYLLRLTAKLKHRAVRKWIDDFLNETDKKLVVFTTHKKVIRKLEERYKDICVKVDGDVTKKGARKEAERRFQNDPKCRIFLGNYKAAGVALTLTAASDLLCADFPWTPGDLTQAEDRIHRIGQKKRATIHYLVARGTIEDTLCRVLRDKQATLSAILDGEGSGDNLDVLTELLQSISPKKKRN